MVDRHPHLDELDKDIYDLALISRYRKYTSRIDSFRVKDEFYPFVVGALNILPEITPTKWQHALSVEYLPISSLIFLAVMTCLQ